MIATFLAALAGAILELLIVFGIWIWFGCPDAGDIDKKDKGDGL